jgi:hypothetical protein
MGTGTSNPPSAEEPVPIILGALHHRQVVPDNKFLVAIVPEDILYQKLKRLHEG